MLKKLFICLALITALILPLNVIAMEDGQQCSLIAGTKVLQILPDHSIRGVIAPVDTPVEIGPQIPASLAENLARQMGLNWTGAHMAMIEIDFGHGPVPVILVVRPVSVEDCQ
jgi:hypothetical protein